MLCSILHKYNALLIPPPKLSLYSLILLRMHEFLGTLSFFCMLAYWQMAFPPHQKTDKQKKKHLHVMPVTCKYYCKKGRGWSSQVWLREGSWDGEMIQRDPQCNHMYLHKREIEGYMKHTEWESMWIWSREMWSLWLWELE